MNKSKKLAKKLCAMASVCALALPGTQMVYATESNSGDFVAEQKEFFAEPEMAHRPYARWWLAEGSHTDETIKESIQELYDAGYGGIEFVTLDESSYLSDEDYAWGSKEWVHDSQLIIKECQRLGMSVSMTSGTHWSTANLTVIDPDMESASQELGYTVTDKFSGEYKGELSLCELPDNTTKQELVNVVAVKVVSQDEESGTVLDFSSSTVVDESALEVTEEDGYTTAVSVDYTAPDDGDYVLFAFYQYGTGEYYSPAATGKSYTINYLDKAGANALIDYWDANVLTDDVQSVIDQIDECDMYMDSLELKTKGPQSTGQLWCKDMLDEFSSRTGYDLGKYLPFLIKTGGDFGLSIVYSFGNSEESQKELDNMRREFYQVTTELYTENCLNVLSDWLHTKNMKLRAENSYGKTFEVTQPVEALDYVETESLEFGNEIDDYRMMSGAAHVFNKRFSSETGAIFYANYMWNNGYWRQIFYMQYASGIQKTVTHGYSAQYGPVERVSWPGYEGMQDQFSERFNKRQPGSVDYEELNTHLSRIQKAMEQGKAQIDLLMLRSDYNLNNLAFYFTENKGLDVYKNMVHSNKGIYWQDTELQNAGYTYEYISPYVLNSDAISTSDGKINTDGVSYQAVVVMENELPFESAQTLNELAKAGVPVVFVNNTQEIVGLTEVKTNTEAASTTGCNDGKDEELQALVASMKELDNVTTVDSEADAYEALKELCVDPRVEYGKSNAQVLSALREDEDVSYLYLYDYMYQDDDSYQGQITLDGNYEVYELDTWSGDVEMVEDCTTTGEKTLLNVEINPGDVKLLILKPTEDVKEETVSEETEPEKVELTGWDLTVDSFEPGEQLLRTETNEETGLTTTEATYDTNHVEIAAGVQEELKPWKDIESIGEEVSGIGTYKTTFTLPEDFESGRKVVFKADSFNYGTASLWINGEKVPVNMDAAKADITDYVKAGANTIEVHVTSSLRNIMRKVGYLKTDQAVGDTNSSTFQSSIGGWTVQPDADSYGMTGETMVEIY